jgi:hypothetical protein
MVIRFTLMNGTLSNRPNLFRSMDSWVVLTSNSWFVTLSLLSSLPGLSLMGCRNENTGFSVGNLPLTPMHLMFLMLQLMARPSCNGKEMITRCTCSMNTALTISKSHSLTWKSTQPTVLKQEKKRSTQWSQPPQAKTTNQSIAVKSSLLFISTPMTHQL